jgi:histone H2A
MTTKAAPVSKSKRAGLLFPVGRFASHMKARRPGEKTSTLASVSMAAALEYITAELLEISSNSARARKKKRITPVDLTNAIKADEELYQLLGRCLVAESGFRAPSNKVFADRRRTKKQKRLAAQAAREAKKAAKEASESDSDSDE